MKRAYAERSNSFALREKIDHLIKSSAEALAVQANSVENAFNTRIAEYKEAKQAAEQNLAQVRQRRKGQ